MIIKNDKKVANYFQKIIKKTREALNNAYQLNDTVERKLEQKTKMSLFLHSALHSKEAGVSEFNANGENIIVSLTTHNKRIYDVWLTIESLLNQTYKPNKLILWLAEDEFNESTIPIMLKRQQERGLEIGFCKDMRSHTKLIPTLKKYPDQVIITVDDDIVYPFDLVENLWMEYKRESNVVLCCRAHNMVFDKKNILLPYNQWQYEYQGQETSMLIFPTGVGGVLYPPHCFHEDITREDLFMKLCPYADDVWFKAMTLLMEIPCKKIRCREYVPIDGNQDIGLWMYNVSQGKNDIQIKQTFDYYNLWDKLKN
jgi:hypothetical protein